MRHGFSLLEVLMVVGIIAALAALLFPAVGIMRRKAIDARCRALLATVSTAIEGYKTEQRRLPVWQGAWIDGDWTWVEANADMLSIELLSAVPDAKGIKRNGYLVGQLIPRDIKDGRVVDPWSRPLIYYASPWSGATSGARPYPGNQMGFELWSAGPDGEFGNLRTADPPLVGDPDNDNIPARVY